MSLEKCHGDEAKQKIIDAYSLTPIVYIRLLAGQKIQGCCGPITDRYYSFEAEHKQTKAIETFVVGYHCGEQFLELIGHSKLQLFNPFQAQGHGGVGGGGAGGGNAVQIHPLNQELSDAIHLLTSAWGGKAPKGSLRTFLDYIRKKPQWPTQDFAIVGFNRILGKDKAQRSLTQIIIDIRIANPTLRNFTFPLMQQVLTNKNEPSHL